MEKRPLWFEQLNDNQLKEMLIHAQDIEILSKTTDRNVLNILETYYEHHGTKTKQLETFCNDVYKEAAYRWLKEKVNYS